MMIMMLNIFSCASRPFVYLLWKNLYVSLLPIFILIFLKLLYKLFIYFGY